MTTEPMSPERLAREWAGAIAQSWAAGVVTSLGGLDVVPYSALEEMEGQARTRAHRSARAISGDEDAIREDLQRLQGVERELNVVRDQRDLATRRWDEAARERDEARRQVERVIRVLPPGMSMIAADYAAHAVGDLVDEVQRLQGVERVVQSHLAKRAEFVNAMKDTPGDQDQADYWRWSGHAESRRHLARDIAALAVPDQPTEAGA